MRTTPSKIKVGDLMAIVHFVKVIATGPDEFSGQDVYHPDHKMRVQGKELLEYALSADQFDNTFAVSRTELAEKLVASPNRPFTVTFTKTDGTERTLRGRLVRPEPLLGRSMVEDLDAPAPNRLRQVDHRTVSRLVVDGNEYVIKG